MILLENLGRIFESAMEKIYIDLPCSSTWYINPYFLCETCTFDFLPKYIIDNVFTQTPYTV